MQKSKLGQCKRGTICQKKVYETSIFCVKKKWSRAYGFLKNGTYNDKWLDLREEPLRINLCKVPPGFSLSLSDIAVGPQGGASTYKPL